MNNEEAPITKRKRAQGTFSCDLCDKQFSRRDHLSRHKRNHDPQGLKYICNWNGCNQRFSRNDVKEKHFKRHFRRKEIEMSSKKSDDKISNDEISYGVRMSSGVGDLFNVDAKNVNDVKVNENGKTIDLFSLGEKIANVEVDMASTEGVMSSTSSGTAGNISSSGASSLFPAENRTLSSSSISNVSGRLPNRDTDATNSGVIFNGVQSPSLRPLDTSKFSVGAMQITENENVFKRPPSTKTLNEQPLLSNLTQWLFCEKSDDYIADRDAILTSDNLVEFPNVYFPSSFEMIEKMAPKFSHNNKGKTICEQVRKRMLKYIPSLGSSPDFGLPHIERYLETYWLIFHPQYPILHRPSFSNTETNPLLLLAMVMIGASMLSCITDHDDLVFQKPSALAHDIAEPLRWLIFSNRDCRPPAKTWVIQALLILEVYESTNGNRDLHERAYLHHCTKIQILRRSSILGEVSLKSNEKNGSHATQSELWRKWIEAESMKRTTLMAFYLDIVNATVYGHMFVLHAHQIKLSLPCDDNLWEYENAEKNGFITPSKSPNFLTALKRILNREKVVTTSFGKKVLLAGLLSIMFQVQQERLGSISLDGSFLKDSWRETISHAIDIWKVDLSDTGCCNGMVELSVSLTESKLDLPSMLKIEDTRCKSPLYHIAQICLRIPHYDYIIFAGASSWMNVPLSYSDFKAASKRIKDWSSSINGRITVVHAYIFLCEMFLSPTNEDITFTYNPNSDPYLHRKSIIASAILVIFAYNFSLEGPESLIFEDVVGDYYPAKENGYTYLRRVRRGLTRCSLGPFHTLHLHDSIAYQNKIKSYAERLPHVEHKNHLVGLLKMIYKSYRESDWEIGKDYSSLFQNCIERCLGAKKLKI